MKYEYADDPERLAAAVAAGVRVEASCSGGVWYTTNTRAAKDFRNAIANDNRYRIPASVVWPPAPWPGAVPSGRTDEDGQPTWLALAEDVPAGWDVRWWSGMRWSDPVVCARDNWVEARPPRPAPPSLAERARAAAADRPELAELLGELAEAVEG